jgi:hypothetical protein
MENMLLASTLIDCAALAALAWVVWRAGREREASLGAQRAALETLRADLGELVADAESRARELEAALASREERLRDLLLEIAHVQATAQDRAAAAATADEPASIDPAEARLLRDLEVNFGRRRA